MAEALGMVEVKGYLGAVVVADAALKAANIELSSAEKIKGGITTILLIGDVAAVTAGVEAGVRAAQQTNSYRAHHIIARTDDQTDEIFLTAKKEIEAAAEEKEKAEKAVTAEVKAPLVKEQAAENSESDLKAELEAKKVVDLRKMALAMKITSLDSKQIKFANKATLVQAILNESEGKDEK